MKLCLLHVFLVMHLYVFLILAFFQQLFQTYLPIYFRASFEKMLCCGNMSNFSAGVYFTILNWFNTYERWRRALGTKVSPFTTFFIFKERPDKNWMFGDFSSYFKISCQMCDPRFALQADHSRHKKLVPDCDEISSRSSSDRFFPRISHFAQLVKFRITPLHTRTDVCHTKKHYRLWSARTTITVCCDKYLRQILMNAINECYLNNLKWRRLSWIVPLKTTKKYSLLEKYG